MLDVGATLEPERAEAVDRVRSSWLPGLHLPEWERIKRPPLEQTSALPLKLAYGSDFPYTEDLFVGGRPPAGTGLVSSHARGGLSTVWGGNVLRYRAKDLQDWPFSSADLDAHYAAVERMMPLAASGDGLFELFPYDTQATKGAALPIGQQATDMLAAAERNRAVLRQLGVHFGQARLAVDPACVRCGNCLFGCPFDYIYNASSSLDRLLKHRPPLDYRPGLKVLSFDERPDHVAVVVREVDTGDMVTFATDRLFIAAGVLQTALIVLSSLAVPTTPVVSMKENQYFLIPALTGFRLRQDPREERLHTLTQAFFDHVGPRGDDYTLHFEIKTYNEFYQQQLRRRLGRLSTVWPPLIGALSRRLVVATGFLHSDYSTTFAVRIERTNDRSTLAVTPELNPATPPRLQAALRTFRQIGRLTGLLPMIRMTVVAEPGRSFHYGGTFPMAAQPRAWQTDRLGRLPGLQRVHVVDASIFPSIPAPTITLTAMANAYRIASSVPVC
jgi:choline dehydrogenase-like flavoprotein